MEKTVTIEKLDHFGRGIAHIDDIPVFVFDALPNETVIVDIFNKKKNFMEAKVIKYLDTSALRKQPNCPYFGQCGGCDIMQLDYKEQLAYKENKIKEIMQKFKLDFTVKSIIPTKDSHYRNKITLKVDKNLGFYQRKTNRVIAIDDCKIASLPNNNIIDKLKNMNLKGIKEIMLRSTNHGTMLDIMGTTYPKEILNLPVSSIYFNSKKIKGDDYIIDDFKDLKYLISPNSFYQVNPIGMEYLYDKVLEYCTCSKQDCILDLYCGIGTIGLYISRHCKEVLGIEVNGQAISDANKNKEINHIDNIEFKTGDVKDVLKQDNFQADIVIVDPPRAGLDKEVLHKLVEIHPQKIIYVSCDPMTLGRDLAFLNEFYDIVELTPVDMFPNTYHIESCVLLKQK